MQVRLIENKIRKWVSLIYGRRIVCTLFSIWGASTTDSLLDSINNWGWIISQGPERKHNNNVAKFIHSSLLYIYTEVWTTLKETETNKKQITTSTRKKKGKNQTNEAMCTWLCFLLCILLWQLSIQTFLQLSQPLSAYIQTCCRFIISRW